MRRVHQNELPILNDTATARTLTSGFLVCIGMLLELLYRREYSFWRHRTCSSTSSYGNDRVISCGRRKRCSFVTA